MSRHVIVALALATFEVPCATALRTTKKGCPAEVHADGKGQCRDVASGALVADDCCLNLNECKQRARDALSKSVSWMAASRKTCSLSMEDVRTLSDGRSEQLDIEKVCQPGCQASASAPLALDSFEECGQSFKKSNARLLKSLDMYRAVAARLGHLAEQCPATPEIEEPTEDDNVLGRYFALREGSSQKCLDFDIGHIFHSQDNAYLHPCNGQDNQMWYWDGEQIKSKANGYCLDFDIDRAYFPNDNVHLLGCNGQANQRWYRHGDELRSRMNNQCLDYHAPLENACMFTCHGHNNQKWFEEEV